MQSKEQKGALYLTLLSSDHCIRSSLSNARRSYYFILSVLTRYPTKLKVDRFNFLISMIFYIKI